MRKKAKSGRHTPRDMHNTLGRSNKPHCSRLVRLLMDLHDRVLSRRYRFGKGRRRRKRGVSYPMRGSVGTAQRNRDIVDILQIMNEEWPKGTLGAFYICWIRTKPPLVSFCPFRSFNTESATKGHSCCASLNAHACRILAKLTELLVPASQESKCHHLWEVWREFLLGAGHEVEQTEVQRIRWYGKPHTNCTGIIFVTCIVQLRLCPGSPPVLHMFHPPIMPLK
jgi:hypothetical protein